MSWDDRIVWITGASSGIGEALAKKLGRDGARVILSGRRVDELQRVAADIPGQSLVLPFDTTDLAGLPASVEQAQSWRGNIDVLVNNAGVGQRSLALDTDFSVYRKLLEVDFFAPLRLTQLVLPKMVERGSGHIAIVSSLSGKIGSPMRTGYAAAKHACVGYFEALRTEVELAYGINVTVVLPGFVNTAIAINALAADGTRRGRTDANIAEGLDPADVAHEIADGLAAKRREIVISGPRDLEVLNMRTRAPEALFDMLAAEGARLARASAGDDGALTLTSNRGARGEA